MGIEHRTEDHRGYGFAFFAWFRMRWPETLDPSCAGVACKFPMCFTMRTWRARHA